MPPAAASFWDDWYRQMAGGHTRDVLLGRVLGLPPGYQSNNLLPGTAIDA